MVSSSVGDRCQHRPKVFLFSHIVGRVWNKLGMYMLSFLMWRNKSWFFLASSYVSDHTCLFHIIAIVCCEYFPVSGLRQKYSKIIPAYINQRNKGTGFQFREKRLQWNTASRRNVHNETHRLSFHAARRSLTVTVQGARKRGVGANLLRLMCYVFGTASE